MKHRFRVWVEIDGNTFETPARLGPLTYETLEEAEAAAERMFETSDITDCEIDKIKEDDV